MRGKIGVGQMVDAWAGFQSSERMGSFSCYKVFFAIFLEFLVWAGTQMLVRGQFP